MTRNRAASRTGASRSSFPTNSARGRSSRPRRRRSAGAALALLACCACGAGEAGGGRALKELERLAYMPPGRCLPRYPDIRTWEPLLVDRFEVSRADWLVYAVERRRNGVEVGPPGSEAWPEETRDWPVSFVTLADAAAFADWRGMRLPTSREWILAAAGPRCHFYPWSDTPQASVANTLDLGLRRLAPCGTFEAGRTPLGCYDMLGNVWEWVTDRDPSEELWPSVDRWDLASQVSVMGGSYASYLRPIHSARERRFNARLVDPRTRALEIGFRCVIEAEAYLRASAPEWGAGEKAAARLRSVGRRWGRPALLLLERLAAEPGAAPGLALLVEGARG